MRVMVLVKATADSEAGTMPSTALLEAMGKYNEGANRTTIDGPFGVTRELVAGFWLWQVKDMAEALEWVKRCPNPMLGPSEIEIRPIFEAADFGEALTPEVAALEDRLRDKLASRSNG